MPKRQSTRLYADTPALVKEAFKLFRINPGAVGVDTETSSLDPYTSKLWSIQIGHADLQVLLPMTKLKNIGEFKDLLMDEDIIKVFHRATFDLKILWNAGLDANNVWCTQTIEQILNAGMFADASLAGTLRRRFGVDMSKAERKDFYTCGDVDCANYAKRAPDSCGHNTLFETSGRVWTPELQEYALKDVEYLVPLMEQQRDELIEEKMDKLASKVELPLVYVTALMEYRGVKIDRKACMAFQQEMANIAKQEGELLTKALDEPYQRVARKIYDDAMKVYMRWRSAHDKVLESTNGMRESYINENNRKCSRLSEEARALRAASVAAAPYNVKPKEPKTINLNAPYQVRLALHAEGVELPDMQRATLEDAKEEHHLIAAIVEHKKYTKLAQMAEIYEKINPVTSRIHPTFNQNVDTGRYSSRDPNAQNIPARSGEGKRFRSLFVADKGNVFVGADFSAIELVIIGVLSRDKNLLYALNNVADLHCFTMSKALGVEYDAVFSVKDGKKNNPSESFLKTMEHARKVFEADFRFPDLLSMTDIIDWVNGLRTNFKNMTYGVAYGISKFGLSKRFHCETETAQDFIDLFFSKPVYPTVRRWLDGLSDFGEDNGYSTTVAGRRRYYRKPKRPSSKDITEGVIQYLKNHFKPEPEQSVYDIVSKAEWQRLYDEMATRLNKEYFQKINRIRRQAANAPIQGTSADITKLSMVYFEDWFAEYAEEHGLDIRKYGIVLTVHDELIVEVPKKHGKAAHDALKDCMQRAAHMFLGNNVKIDVQPKIMQCWEKD